MPCCRLDRSDTQPMRKGDGASPRMWMMTMFAATAIERRRTGLTLMMTALRGPVFRNRKKIATAKQIEKIRRSGEAMAIQANGMAIRTPRPENSMDARGRREAGRRREREEHAPAARHARSGHEEGGEGRPRRDGQEERRHPPAALAQREEVGEKRRQQRPERGLADADQSARQQQDA